MEEAEKGDNNDGEEEWGTTVMQIVRGTTEVNGFSWPWGRNVVPARERTEINKLSTQLLQLSSCGTMRAGEIHFV